GGAAASLADRRGRTPGGSGHSMPSAGSFQASERSASRDQKSVTWYCTRVAGASERKPCAKPGGTHSDRALTASSVSARLRPNEGDARRRSTTTSKISPASTRRSFPWAFRSEERRVGKECRCRGAPEQVNKKYTQYLS